MDNPGSLGAARDGCDCPVVANNKGMEEPEGGWVIRATCKVHGTLVKEVPPIVNMGDALVHVHIGRWGRLWSRIRFRKPIIVLIPGAPQEEPPPPLMPLADPPPGSPAASLLAELQRELEEHPPPPTNEPGERSS
jgi:hypothetical protein